MKTTSNGLKIATGAHKVGAPCEEGIFSGYTKRVIFTHRAPRAFTLIEILLAVAIVGLLAGIILAGVSAARSKARDAVRVADMKAIATALEFFYDSKGHYPVAVGGVSECGAASGNWIPDGTNFSWSDPYLSSQPRDPLENCGGSPTHAFTYQSDGTAFQLTTTLEGSSPAGEGGSTTQTYAYNGSSFSPYVDTTPISVTLSTPVSNPTDQTPIPLVVSFSRDVVDFTQSLLSVTSGVVSGFSEVFASIYDVFITPTDNNTVVVSITGGTVHDQNGIANTGAQFTITYDSLQPHVALSPDPLPTPVKGAFTVSVNFTVAVVDFTAASVSVTNATVSNVTGSGTNYSFTVTPTSPGAVQVSIPANATHSAAGNGNVVSNIISTTYAP
jgi:prepilin-type N-terminal cleavage/methylation domain-containing protein